MKRSVLEYTKEALKDLKKLDNSVARIIFAWLKKNIDGCSDPRAHGKGLTANRSGQWRYRIGDYRAICVIEDNRLVVLCITVAHRREVYGK